MKVREEGGYAGGGGWGVHSKYKMLFIDLFFLFSLGECQ